MDAPDLQVSTDIGAALAAGVAVAAGGHLVDDHAVAHLELCHPSSYLHHIPHHLMADHPWVGGRRVLPVVDPHIGTADPGGPDLHQHVIPFIDRRLFHIDDLKVIRLYDLDCFHLILPLFICLSQSTRTLQMILRTFSGSPVTLQSGQWGSMGHTA